MEPETENTGRFLVLTTQRHKPPADPGEQWELAQVYDTTVNKEVNGVSMPHGITVWVFERSDEKLLVE